MKKIAILFVSLFMLPFLLGATYNYSFYRKVIHSSPGMTFATFIDSNALGIELKSPEYFVVYEDVIHTVDSGLNSLILIDDEFHLIGAPKTSFTFAAGVDPGELNLREGSFKIDPDTDEIIALTLNKPEGLDVKESGVYIADTNNRRIIRLNHDFEVLEIFADPEDPVFEEVAFQPSKITVDVTGRMYVVAKNIFEGIIELSREGKFNRYVGVNPITLTPLEIFRRSLMSEAQLLKLRRYLPTSYTSVMINEESFMYATARPRDNHAENMIQLINPKGIDVINRNGYFPPMGDVHFIDRMNNHVIHGPSLLVDITYTDGGIYSVLDQKRSRIFTYDIEGNLLYINGSSGSQRDKFAQGVALNYLNEDLIVLDRINRSFVVYRLTEFGTLVNKAVNLENDGRFTDAAVVWKEILTKNSNYEIAYNGIGKALLREGQYKEAVENFKLGHDTYYYSKAYKEYRNEKIRENFTLIMGGITLVAGFLIGRSLYKKRKKGESLLYED